MDELKDPTKLLLEMIDSSEKIDKEVATLSEASQLFNKVFMKATLNESALYPESYTIEKIQKSPTKMWDNRNVPKKKIYCYKYICRSSDGTLKVVPINEINASMADSKFTKKMKEDYGYILKGKKVIK